MNKILTLVLPILVTLTSCEKVIDVNLDNVTPQLVIEGTITNGSTPDTVKISKTINFSASNTFAGVADALVIVTDNTTGTIDTLTESTKTGIYLTSKIQGTPQHQYSLRVVCEGKEYTSQSTMPQQVTFDSLYQETETLLGKKVTYVRSTFTDPADQTNQYRFKVYINSKVNDEILVSKDTYYNGLTKTATFASSINDYNPNDTVRVDFMCIDKNTYTYFYSLSEALDANSSVAANPTSNITGGCLGYFSANTFETKKIIVK